MSHLVLITVAVALLLAVAAFVKERRLPLRQAIIDRAHAAQEKSLAEVEAAQQAFAKQFELKLEN